MSSGGDERFGCPGVVPVDGEAWQCGLLVGHDGPCTPSVGDYLPPPILHPLDVYLVHVRSWFSRGQRLCPNGHGGRWACYGAMGRSWAEWQDPSITVDGPIAAFRHWQDGAWRDPETEMLWRFEPCGCEFRQILTA